MKRKNLFVLFLGLMFFISLVSASTIVHVKTLPRQDFYLTPISVGEGFNAITPPQFYSSDEYGDLVIELENISSNLFSLFVTLKDDSGATTFRKKFEDSFVKGTEFNITVAPEGATLLQTPVQAVFDEPETNVTGNNLTNSSLITNTSSNLTANASSNLTFNDTDKNIIIPVKKVKKSKLNDSLISGEATGGMGEIFGINLLWGILGIVILLVIIVFLVIGRKSGKELNPYARGVENHYQNELNKAKKEFKSAKDKLELLKGKKEILAVEKKIESDRKQLEELLSKEHKKSK